MIVGQTTPLELLSVPVWRQGQGWITEYYTDGTREEIDAVAGQYAGAAGVNEVRVSQLAKPFWRVTVAFAGRTREEAQNPPNPDNQVETTWAFPRNELQRDIWTHPRVEEQLRAMSLTYRGRFRADVEAWLGGQSSIEYTDNAGAAQSVELSAEALIGVAVAFGAQDAEIREFFDALSEGVTTYKYSQRVLRLTRTGPTSGEWLQANTNVNRVWTRAKVIADLQPPDWIQAKLPEGFYWKTEPEEEMAGTKLQMTQEWEYFGVRYSEFAYGEPIS
jgi:hypothetical protein